MEGLEGGGGNCENHQGPGRWGNEKSQERSTAVKPDGRDAERSQLERDGTAFWTTSIAHTRMCVKQQRPSRAPKYQLMMH